MRIIDFLLQGCHFNFDNMSFFFRAVDVGVFGINFIYVVLDDFLKGIEGAEVFHYGFADNFVLVVYGPFDFDFGKFVEEVIYIIVAERADFVAAGEEQGSVDFHRGIGEGSCG